MLAEMKLHKLESLDWDDMKLVASITSDVLHDLANDPRRLTSAVESVMQEEKLLCRCETNEHFHRIILHDDPNHSYRIILLSMHPNDRDIIHNHRATFSTLVLAGGYSHSIYGSTDLNEARSDMTLPMRVMQRNEEPGSIYSLHYSTLHSTRPTSNHMSIIIRGPSALEKRIIIDPVNESPVWLVGGSDNPIKKLSDKRMSHETVLWFYNQLMNLRSPCKP
jgi:hypothetical protein